MKKNKITDINLNTKEELLTTLGHTENDMLYFLEEEVRKADEKVAEADLIVAKAQEMRQKAVIARDSAIEERDKSKNPNQNQIDIMEFLEGQKKIRNDRALLALQVNKAPIDQVMQRSSGYGKTRPSIPMNRV